MKKRFLLLGSASFPIIYGTQTKVLSQLYGKDNTAVTETWQL